MSMGGAEEWVVGSIRAPAWMARVRKACVRVTLDMGVIIAMTRHPARRRDGMKSRAGATCHQQVSRTFKVRLTCRGSMNNVHLAGAVATRPYLIAIGTKAL